MLPKKPDDILLAQLFRNVASLGSIHVAKSPVPSGLIGEGIADNYRCGWV